MNEKEQLISFIKEQINHGVNIETIKSTVKIQGWTDDDINTAISQAQNEMSAVGNAPVAPQAPYGSAPVEQVVQAVGRTITSKIITTVVTLLVLGGVSGGAYVGYNYYKGSQISLGKAVINSIKAFSDNKIKSGEFSMVAEVTAKDVGKNYSDLATDPAAKQITDQLQNVAVNLTYSGIVNRTNDNKFEMSGDLSASIKNPDGGSLGMFGSQEVALKYKTFSDNIYLNVQKIPSLTSMIIPANIDTTKYLNQWFFMPTTMTTEYSKSYTDAVGTTTIPDYVKKQIISIFDESGAFTVVDKKSEKTDKGTAVTAFYLKIDWDKLGDEMIRLSKENSKTDFTKSQELEMRANIEKFKELLVTNSILKVFVGTDGYVHGYVSTGDLMDKTNKQIGSYKLSFVADSFNQSFTIDRPANARDINEVMTEINSLMNTSSSKTPSVSSSKTTTSAKTTAKSTLVSSGANPLAGIYIDNIHNGDSAVGAVLISGVYTKDLLMKIIEAHIGRLIPSCVGTCDYEIVDASVVQPGNKQIVKVQVSNGTVKYFDVTDYNNKAN